MNTNCRLDITHTRRTRTYIRAVCMHEITAQTNKLVSRGYKDTRWANGNFFPPQDCTVAMSVFIANFWTNGHAETADNFVCSSTIPLYVDI